MSLRDCFFKAFTFVGLATCFGVWVAGTTEILLYLGGFVGMEEEYVTLFLIIFHALWASTLFIYAIVGERGIGGRYR